MGMVERDPGIVKALKAFEGREVIALWEMDEVNLEALLAKGYAIHAPFSPFGHFTLTKQGREALRELLREER
jgi:hypothetical protein